MTNYVSSNNNRFYVAVEDHFGQAQAIDSTNRLTAVTLNAHQQLSQTIRRDKTGTRSFWGSSPLSRRATAFSVTTYLASWNGVDSPGYGPLLQSVCGLQPALFSQTAVAQMVDPVHLVTATPHGLKAGGGLSQGSEVRFVASVVDELTILLNAPFSAGAAPGSLLAPCLTYSLGNTLPSVTIFDYWDPSSAVQRVITGATADSLAISLNGDFHELTFAGLGADLIDSESFIAGNAGLQKFPIEPSPATLDYSLVGGHLGEAWLGVTAQQVFTLTQATIQIKNNLVARNMEFGFTYPTSFAAGLREVSISFSLFADDSSTVRALYSAAKTRTPISVMFQLGQQQGQLMGIYLPAVQLEIPAYDDHETRLIWDFKANIAQGTNNDEIFIAVA